MWRNLSDRIHRFSTGWVTIASLVIFLLFTALVLPGQASRSEAVTGEATSPDMSFYYTADELYQLASSYGEEGREAYIRARFTFDLLWSIVYGFFLSTAISWTFRDAFSRESKWQLANIVPILGVLFDYLENISTSIVMARYPSPTAVLDELASVFSMAKWIFVVASFALLLVGVLVLLSRRVGLTSRQ
jgi:hypothetical protein